MKIIILYGLIVFFFTSCQPKEITRYTNSSPEVNKVQELVKDYNEGNWESWLSHYADTAIVRHNTIAPSTPLEIQQGLQNNLQPLSKYGFSDEAMFCEMIIDDKGQKWVNFWGTWEGTMAATGEELVIPIHLTLQFVNGKIVLEQGYYDLSKYLAAIEKLENQKPGKKATVKN
ncbi:SnoaL-like domain-containing protein [Arenibacter nanhaiticus]|uniref:SnoaL-like domain-containing protein n=1 Tax=Arenibacter nanhaiticus TaxID=558155 RepID=A0A1M6E6X7_9FLAO|nr:nuclear transport factor 2 family protein [Arenibacter nanhaiticus]SHI81153.1 SnoaL-like domain-containing protein [Arenibacter nanhaiticus]